MPLAADLDAYFSRLAWDGETTATLDTLTGLLRAHMEAIPFENLDVLLGRPIRLDLASIESKLVTARRGGYCFEHATLFAAVLERLGFAPVRHSARVVLATPRHESPRAHMFLTVTLPEGRFVLDPGFGGPAPPFPVPLGASATDKETHWMAHENGMAHETGIWILRTRAQGDAWMSSLEQDHPVDYEMASHYTATHSGSPFRHRLMMSRFTGEGRTTVLNDELTIAQGSAREKIKLRDRAALRAAVNAHFGFDLPEIETLHVPAIPEWT